VNQKLQEYSPPARQRDRKRSTLIRNQLSAQARLPCVKAERILAVLATQIRNGDGRSSTQRQNCEEQSQRKPKQLHGGEDYGIGHWIPTPTLLLLLRLALLRRCRHRRDCSPPATRISITICSLFLSKKDHHSLAQVRELVQLAGGRRH
jgi:hypothetical protein